MKFAIHGPFEIPRGKKGLITDVKQFWKELAEYGGEGLLKAHGVYVFAIKGPRTDKSKPWYVGKASKNFRQEALNAENIRKYNGKLDETRRGKPWLFLLPELTESGARFARKADSVYTKELELMLIRRGLRANPDLLNLANTKMTREIEVAGFINSKQGQASESSREFKKAFTK